MPKQASAPQAPTAPGQPPTPPSPARSGNASGELPLKPIVAGPFGDRIDLKTLWLLHSGSHAAEGEHAEFADPALDDSRWKHVDTRKSLVMQEIWNPNDLWYRLHVHLTPGSHGLALALSKVGGSYRVYVDGRELGGHGAMSGQGDYLIASWDTYSIPDDLLASNDIVIAVHALVGTVNRTSFTLLDGISPSSVVFLGPQTVLVRDEQMEHKQSGANLLALWCVLLVLSLSLGLLVRKEKLYFLLAVFAGSQIVNSVTTEYAARHYMSNAQWVTLPINIALAIGAIAGLEFCRIVAGSARRIWFSIFEAFYLLSSMLLYVAASGAVSYVVYSITGEIARGSIYLVVGILLLIGVARRRRNAVILAGVAAVYLVYLALWDVLSHVQLAAGFWTEFGNNFTSVLTPGKTAEFATVVALFALLIAQTLDIVRERGAISTEIEAARTMQRLLLTRSSEPTPGFTVETAYLPAGEVGGDFFLVSPTRHGSLAAVVGDVSGKGLRAAMQVSMILGVLRREPSRDPATVLCSMNEALLSQNDTGFTTACAVELCPDGRYTVANAGHISPYLTGHGRSLELIAPPAFPLGLAGDQTYDVLHGKLEPGQRLVLMSDGIVEARASHGELYGFERLLPLTLRPAGEIAATALAFGQEDDITVVTLSCQFVETPVPRPQPEQPRPAQRIAAPSPPPPAPPILSGAPPPPRP